MDFYTSDTHWFHKNIIEYSKRPFKDVDEMTSELISRWNKVVTAEDRVIHLGDVSMGWREQLVPVFSALNGYKVQLPGNHDGNSSVMRERIRAKTGPLYAEIFDEVWPEICEVEIDGRTVRLSHYPHHGDSRDHDRHLDRRPPDDGVPLIHGHTHSSDKAHGRAMYHVGVDAHDFTPVPETQIIEWLDTL